MGRLRFGPWSGIMMRGALALMLLCGTAVVALADAPGESSGIPPVMPYEGYLTDEEGAPIPDGTHDFEFRLYSAAEGGEAVWTEEHLGVSVTGGTVRLSLGDGTTPRPLDLPFDRQYFLGVRIDDGPEMVPRLELMPTAYAFRARSANTVPDLSITSQKLAPLCVTDDKIASVSWGKITDVPTGSNGNGPHSGGGPPVPANIWHTNGNRSTDPEKDYVGTSDAVDLCFRTSSVERMRVLSTGEVGIGTPTPLTTLHVVSMEGGPDGSIESYPVIVDGRDQGIAIRITGEANGDNNFISFIDDDGICGRVEGQTYSEWLSDAETIATIAYLTAVSAAEVVAIAEQWDDPDISDLLDTAASIAYTSALIQIQQDRLGVAYCSGGGDYAEWLPRVHENEEIEAGDIVGVYGGMITKRTNGAHQILPVSSNPIVLGNMPPEEVEHLFEPVSFMGQVPVKVVGPVGEGDFIIPSGLGDGTGIAIAPELMTADEYSRVVGRAWTASDREHVKLVNVAVGLDYGDVAAAVRRQESETAALQGRLASANQEIEEVRAELDALRAQVLALDDLAQEVARLRTDAGETETAATSGGRLQSERG